MAVEAGGAGNAPNRCDNCGAHVDPHAYRVLSDADGELHACRNCAERTRLASQAACREERDYATNVWGCVDAA